MFLALLIAVLVILFLMEAPRLWKAKLTKDLVVFSCLLGISAYLGLAQIYGWLVPNPARWLFRMFGGA